MIGTLAAGVLDGVVVDLTVGRGAAVVVVALVVDLVLDVAASAVVTTGAAAGAAVETGASPTVGRGAPNSAEFPDALLQAVAATAHPTTSHVALTDVRTGLGISKTVAFPPPPLRNLPAGRGP
jgi:hypothetical protein